MVEVGEAVHMWWSSDYLWGVVERLVMAGLGFGAGYVYANVKSMIGGKNG